MDWSRVEFVEPRKARRPYALAPTVAACMTGLDLTMLSLLAGIAWPHDGMTGFRSLEGHRWELASATCVLACLLLADAPRGSPTNIGPDPPFDFRPLWRAASRFACTAGLASALLSIVSATPKATAANGVFWIAIGLCWLISSRSLCAALLRLLARSSTCLRNIVVIGAPEAPEDIVSSLANKGNVVRFYNRAILDEPGSVEMNELSRLGRKGFVDTVLVAVEDGVEWADTTPAMESLHSLPMQIVVRARPDTARNFGPAVRMFDGPPFEVLASPPISYRDISLKTLLDRVGAVFLLVLLSPFLSLAAAGVALTSSGPVVFRQARQGWCGKSFTMFKFRTMRERPDGGCWQTETRRNDPRCTRFGRLLRMTSFDELPQLINVLRGEMSLIGPRPHAPGLHDLDRADRAMMAEYAQRHRVKPGITGWAQIHGARGATGGTMQMRRRVALDLYYIDHWSFGLDFLILIRTPFNLVGGNAY